jgi:hypothetical protein
VLTALLCNVNAQGVWLSSSPKLAADLPTLVLDLEGNDGRERGEDNTNFERQVVSRLWLEL